MYIVQEIIDEILESELPMITKEKKDFVSREIFKKVNKMFKDFEYNSSSIHAMKSYYCGIPIVEFDYLEGRKNYVEINKCCAVKTRGFSIIGKVIKIKDKYMIVQTANMGKVKMMYSKITGMIPCGLSDDYFKR